MNYPMTRHDTTSERDEAGEFAALVQRVGMDTPRLPLAAPVLDEAAARDAARKAVADLLDKQALDAMLAQVKGDGLRLTGPGGFLSEMVKAVLERGLQAELTEHLGYRAHDAAGNRLAGPERLAALHEVMEVTAATPATAPPRRRCRPRSARST